MIYLPEKYNSEDFHAKMVGRQWSVTSRSFETILSYCNLDDSDILTLSHNAQVVEAGSGIFQNFAHGVRRMRPDIRMISVDPTLAIPLNADNVSAGESGMGTTLDYSVAPIGQQAFVNSYYSKQLFRYRHAERLKRAANAGGIICSIAPELDLEDSSTDLFVDSYGLAHYVRGEDFPKYFYNIQRSLAQGGVASLYPIGFTPNIHTSYPERAIAESKTILAALISEYDNLAVDFYTGHDGVGMKIQKQ